jgi:hypothetical protein
VGRLNGTVSEVALKLVMEMGRWRVSLVRKREVRERLHDDDDDEFGLGKSVLVLLGLRRREYEEKVGMEAIEEREGDRERFCENCLGWVGLDEFVVCTQHFLLLLE